MYSVTMIKPCIESVEEDTKKADRIEKKMLSNPSASLKEPYHKSQAEHKSSASNHKPKTPIDQLHFTYRTFRTLKNNQIYFVEDIYDIIENDSLQNIPGVGDKTEREIKRSLEKYSNKNKIPSSRDFLII